jgi:hypothetical protein
MLNIASGVSGRLLQPWRAFWVLQAMFWVWRIVATVIEIRHGAVDSYHHEHSREAAGAIGGFLLAIAALRTSAPRPRHRLSGITLLLILLATVVLIVGA